MTIETPLTDPLGLKLKLIGELHASIDDATADCTDALDYVQALRMIRDTSDSALRDAVRHARACGETWDTLGRYLGTSRQAAWERYGAATDQP